MAGIHLRTALPRIMVASPMIAPAFHEDWFAEDSQRVLAQLVALASQLPGAFIEIGAWEGRSTVAMANAAYPRQVLTCDTWRGSGSEISEQLAAERDVFAQWQANVAAWTKGNVVPHRMGWREFLAGFRGKVALAFIDAEHSYVEVRDNIRALLPLMVPGGVICGDDVHHGPVKDAVCDVLGEDATYLASTLWVWQMPINPDDFAAYVIRGLYPALWPSADEWMVHAGALVEPWRRYVDGDTDQASHAVSLSTATFLRVACEAVGAKRALDLGSGFSSYALRTVCEDVTSVDDDDQWLARTWRFLSDEKQSVAGLVKFEDFTPEPVYDVVFHDFAGGDKRNATMDMAIECVRPGGVIIFDDAHHRPHHEAMLATAERHGVTLHSLRLRTLDPIERYAMVGIVPEVAPTPLTLAELYAERCQTPSDIVRHLPRMVDLVRALDAKHVIELGTRSGVSTIAWLHALNETGGRLTSVDLDPKPALGDWPHWSFIQGDDLAVADDLEPADIVFIDTSHHYAQTVAELERYRHLVNPGGVICLHDTELATPEGAPDSDPPFPVKRAVVEFCDRHGLDWLNYPDCYGFAIIKAG